MTRALAIAIAVTAAILVAGPGQAATCKSKHPPAACKHPKPKPRKPPAPAVLASRLSLGASVINLVDGFGSLWARLGGDAVGGETIVRIDPSTNTVTAKITVGKGFGLAVGDGAVWAPNFGAETLTRIDPTTNGIAAVIPLPDTGADAVATTPGAVWVGTAGAIGAPGMLVRVDPKTNAVVGTTREDDGVSTLAANSTAVWLIAFVHVARAEPATGAITVLPGAIASGMGGGARLAADDAGVWIAGGLNLTKFSFEKLDPTTGGVVAQLQLPQAVDVALGLGSVWVTTQFGSLVRIDPASAKVTGSMSTDLDKASRIALAAGSIWIGDSSGALERFSPK